MTDITPYTIEHHVEVNAGSEFYTIHTAGGIEAVISFDAVMDEIERVVIELVGRNALPFSYLDNELTSVRASRGTVSAYDTLINLRDRLRKVCDKQGEKAVANLTPQLMGLEGHRVEVAKDGERWTFVVGVGDDWMPLHFEITDNDLRQASREYDDIVDLGVA